jgi:hypothetical protein
MEFLMDMGDGMLRAIIRPVRLTVDELTTKLIWMSC